MLPILKEYPKSAANAMRSAIIFTIDDMPTAEFRLTTSQRWQQQK
jgi:hypothetical protein